MRSSLPIVLAFGLLAGCAGNIADHIGPRSGIIADELTRYGYDLTKAACVGERLGSGLAPLPLRRLERAASSVQRGYFDPERLTPRDMAHVAGSLDDPQVATAIAGAHEACGITAEQAAREAAAKAAAEAAAEQAAPEEAVWLNLGSAPTGQQIAIDASTLEQDGNDRQAWFRLTNPGAEISRIAYWLRVDCAARTIDPLGQRRPDPSGAEVYTEYPPEDDDTMAVEDGTVMQIAFLSLCR